MPIPFLLIGIGAVTAVVGAGKSVKAVVDQKDAKQTNSYAKAIVETAKSELDRDRKTAAPRSHTWVRIRSLCWIWA